MASEHAKKDRPGARFHGRVAGTGHQCAWPGCDQPGEFRAPPAEGGLASDRPPEYQWFCLDHVREFNARYNFFAGMSADEIAAAQRPYAGWERETRAFASAGADRPPVWADFSDPLDAIGTRFRARVAEERLRRDGKPLSDADRRSLKVLGLDTDADRRALRSRYSELVRQYHPDRNGGDRSHEARLRAVIDAYQALRKSPAFA
ncbi:J domain-containing protein [Sphingomonas sp. GlSt437]|uniref:J domain-containing protein n=1 Tax=Sphingomonas sp. GlSt437 TaxID=3389970 RepID=UPI003A849439